MYVYVVLGKDKQILGIFKNEEPAYDCADEFAGYVVQWAIE